MLNEEQSAAVILRGYRATRSQFGVNRIRLGSYLHIIKEHKLWAGISESWEAFLAAENINPNAARQYINVAKKFIHEMDLDEETLSKLAGAGITAMEKAAKFINKDNQADVLSALTALSERDAIQRIIELAAEVEDSKSDAPTLRVLKVLREYHDLPPDLQYDFRHRLEKTEAVRAHRNGTQVQNGKGQSAPPALPASSGLPQAGLGFRRMASKQRTG